MNHGDTEATETGNACVRAADRLLLQFSVCSVSPWFNKFL